MNLLSSKIHCHLLFISSIIISCNDDKIVYPEGGYKYPSHVEDIDTTFYCYPLKDLAAPFDTIKLTDTYHLLRLFDECNLSLKPAKKTIFRLTYVDWHCSTVITLTPREIIVKKQTKLWKYPLYDRIKLDKTEWQDFQNFEFLAANTDNPFYLRYKYDFDSLLAVNSKLLKSEYYKDLFDKAIHGDKELSAKLYKHDFDSLTTVNPKLLDSRYYKYLLDKSSDPGNDKFEYSITKVPISKKIFAHLINLINESGYWQLPFENKCEFVPTDASYFILEANTTRKYKFVTSIECVDNITKYTKACQELIKYAKADDKILLIRSGAATADTPVVKSRADELRLIEIKEEPKSKKKKAK